MRTLNALRHRRRGFVVQFFTLTLLPLMALVIVVALGSVTIHQREMRAMVAERDERAVRAAALALSERLSHGEAALHALADRAASEPVPQPGTTRLAAILAGSPYLVAEFDGGVAYYSPAGDRLAATPTAVAASAQPALRAAVSLAAAAGRPAYSVPWQAPEGGPIRLAIAVPAGDASVVAVGVLSPEALDLESLVNELTSGPNAHVILVSGDGRLLFATGDQRPERPWLEHPGVAPALAGQAGTLFTQDPLSGQEMAVAYSDVSPVGWALVADEPWSSVVSPLMQTSLVGPLVVVPVLLLAGLALLLAVRSVINPLQRLEQQSRALAAGEPGALERPVGGIAEIESLQQTLRQMAQQIHADQEAIRRYLGALTRSQEDERRRLARELHDETIQSLIALDQRVQLAQKALGGSAPAVAERLAELRAMTATLLEEVRRVIRALRPIYLEDLGLLPALEMLVRDLEKTAGVQARFTVEGEPARLAPEREIAVYRVVQEALSNIARHAAAEAAQVRVVFGGGEMSVRVHDNGRGFVAPRQPGDLSARGHYGLIGMHERAEHVGGRLTIQARPGQGTTVEVRVPEGEP